MSLDLAAKSVDLVRAVTEILTSSTPVTQAASEVVQWLGHEGINKDNYLYFMECSRAVTFPKDVGLQIRGSITKAEEKISKAGGLQLLRPSSIGRWMAFNYDYS